MNHHNNSLIPLPPSLPPLSPSLAHTLILLNVSNAARRFGVKIEWGFESWEEAPARMLQTKAINFLNTLLVFIIGWPLVEEREWEREILTVFSTAVAKLDPIYADPNLNCFFKLAQAE